MIIRSRLLSVSRKDLAQVTSYLIDKNRGTLESLDKALKYALNHPIPYRRTGAAHKKGVGPARTPQKVINLLIQEFKCYKGFSQRPVLRLYNELKPYRRAGIVRAGRGRGYRKDNRCSRFVIEFK